MRPPRRRRGRNSEVLATQGFEYTGLSLSSACVGERRRYVARVGVLEVARQVKHQFFLLREGIRQAPRRLRASFAGAPMSTDLRPGVELGRGVTVGEHCFINRGTVLKDGTVIGDGVAIGPWVYACTYGHQVGPPERRAGELTHAPVVIESGVWIGARAVLFPGTRVGSGAVIAAGAVVAKDVPANTLVAGVPARVIRRLDS